MEILNKHMDVFKHSIFQVICNQTINATWKKIGDEIVKMRVESEHLIMGNETYISKIVKSEQLEKDSNHSFDASNDEAVR